MKKNLLIVICLFLLVITACSKKGESENTPTPEPVPSNTLTCMDSEESNGVMINMELEATFDANNKLTDSVIIYHFPDEETTTKFCGYMLLLDDPDNGIIINCESTYIAVNGYTKAYENENQTSIHDFTKEEFKNYMTTNEGMTCN